MKHTIDLSKILVTIGTILVLFVSTGQVSSAHPSATAAEPCSTSMLLSTYPTPGAANTVFVSGDRAYVLGGDWSGGSLQILDISDPGQPIFLGSFDLPGWSETMGIFVTGNTAYIADYAYGLLIIDISDPANPTLLGSYESPGDFAQAVYISDNIAYVAFYYGLQIIDVSNPTNPTLLGSYAANSVVDISVSGNLAFLLLASDDSSLEIIDVSDPQAPNLMGTYGFGHGNWPSDVYVSGYTAYVVYSFRYGTALEIIDVSDPVNPSSPNAFYFLDSVTGLYVSGNTAYVTTIHEHPYYPEFSLRMIDVSDPNNLVPVGSFDMPGSASDVYVSGNVAYVTGGYYGGLKIIDISNPLMLLSTYPTPGAAKAVFVSADRAYVLGGDWSGASLQIIDISDPRVPMLLGSYDLPGWSETMGIYVSGNTAYVADYDYGLLIIDVSDPTSPTLLGSYESPGDFAQAVYVSDNKAYVAFYYGLQIIDVSDPANPTLLGSYAANSVVDISVSGNLAFLLLASDDSSLEIIDVSDPQAPNLMGTYGFGHGNWPSDVYVSGYTAYVVYSFRYGTALEIIDVSDPVNPSSPNAFYFLDSVTGLYVSGNTAYVTTIHEHPYYPEFSLRMIDVSDPNNLVPVGSFDMPGSASDVYVSGNVAYVTGGYYGGLHMIETDIGYCASNTSPVVGTISAPVDPNQVNTSVTAGAEFTDDDTLDAHTAVWEWGDGTTSAGIVTEVNGSGTVSGSNIYTGAGVYTVKLTVIDDEGATGESLFQFIVIYDPSAGFVTGGGWINSLAGACKLTAVCEGATGKANFGFEARYKKGANIPTGQTQFNFKAGSLNFHSTEYQWLVVAGAKAQYKGYGTINGSGEYGFMLTAIDGQINGGGGVDKFRIKIWDRVMGEMIYDNQMGAADDADPSTAIGGGSIVIHK